MQTETRKTYKATDDFDLSPGVCVFVSMHFCIPKIYKLFFRITYRDEANTVRLDTLLKEVRADIRGKETARPLFVI